MSRRCRRIRPVEILRKLIPLADWLPSYDWKNNVLGDIVAGITVAVMHIPQGALHRSRLVTKQRKIDRRSVKVAAINSFTVDDSQKKKKKIYEKHSGRIFTSL